MKKYMSALLVIATMLNYTNSFAQAKTKHHRTARHMVAGCPAVPVRHHYVKHYVKHHAKKPAMHEEIIFVDDYSKTASVDINKGKVYINDSLVATLKNPRYENDQIIINYIAPPTPVAADVANENSYTANNPGKPLLGVFTCNSCDGGAMIEDIIPCSPADKAGLDPGDVITKINDKDINNKEDLVTAIGGYNVGDNVSITYMHYGRIENTQAELGEKEKVENCDCAQMESYSSCNSCYSHGW